MWIPEIEKYDDKLKALATLLNGKVKNEGAQAVYRIISIENGMELWVGIDGNKFNIYGAYPRSIRNESCKPRETVSIGVNAEKSVEKLHADIVRRFMPKYAEEFNMALETKALWDDHHRNKDNQKAELIDMGMMECKHTHNYVYGFGVDIHIRSDSHKLEIRSCPIELCKAIVGLCKTYKKDHKND